MQYHVIYTTPNDRRRWSVAIEAPTDAEAMHVALAVIPPGGTIDEIPEIELPMAA